MEASHPQSEKEEEPVIRMAEAEDPGRPQDNAAQSALDRLMHELSESSQPVIGIEGPFIERTDH